MEFKVKDCEFCVPDDKIQEIKSRGSYWLEVIKRENKSPLNNEWKAIASSLGPNLLWILLHYIELLKEEKKEEKNEN